MSKRAISTELKTNILTVDLMTINSTQMKNAIDKALVDYDKKIKRNLESVIALVNGMKKPIE